MCNQYTPGKFNAMVQGKCPRCQSGKMFKHNAISTSFMQMYENCPVCDLRYEIEPGFFWGAMYVSYGFSCAILIMLGGALALFAGNPDFWVYMAVIIPVFLLSSPFTFRYARIVMIYLFSPVRFEEKLANK